MLVKGTARRPQPWYAPATSTTCSAFWFGGFTAVASALQRPAPRSQPSLLPIWISAGTPVRFSNCMPAWDGGFSTGMLVLAA